MPNHVGNIIIAAGPDDEIARLFDTCFHVLVLEEEGDDEGLQFDFQAIVPVDDNQRRSVDPVSGSRYAAP